MTTTPAVTEVRLEAACNQAAVQFHGKRFSELDSMEQLILRKRIRMVLKAADSQTRHEETVAEETPSALERQDKLIRSAIRDRPAQGSPEWAEYQSEVVVPLIVERDRLRQEENEARRSQKLIQQMAREREEAQRRRFRHRQA